MTDPFPDELETERLRLEALSTTAVDLDALYESRAHDPDLDEVFRWVPVDRDATPKDTLAFVRSAAANRDDADAITYVVRPREGEPDAGDIAGTTTLFVDWDRRTAEFAIVLRKRFWGRGYSGERAGALIALAFERLDLGVVAVSCVAGNDRSRRAIETYVEAHGGQFEGLVRNGHRIGGEPVDLRRYATTDDQYATASIETTDT